MARSSVRNTGPLTVTVTVTRVSNLVFYAQSTITVISGRDSYSDENNTLVVVFMSRITSYLSEALLKLNDLTMLWTITAERR